MARRAIKARWLGKRKGSYAMVQDWLPDSGRRRRRKRKSALTGMHRCSRCGRTIFGGPKGMRTHLHKKHRARKRR